MNVGRLREVALLPVLVLLIIVGAVVSPAFLTISNFAGIGQQSSALGVVVVGESLILMIGGMDLSLESTYGLAPMVAAWLIVPVAAYGAGTDLSPYLGIGVLLAVGAAIGLVNGLLIVKGRLNGFIVTLGMTIVLAGLQNGIVKAQAVKLPPLRSRRFPRAVARRAPCPIPAHDTTMGGKRNLNPGECEAAR